MALAKFIGALSFFSCVASSLAAPTVLTKRSDVVPFTIDLTWGDFNPTGGVSRKAILTNGTIPGPALQLKVGQQVEFTVLNNLPFNTSVHFHGIQQTGTPYSDGVPGLTQYPIAAGGSFLYTWTADESGTYFYHAHHKGQMMDGLYGAIIIEAADDAPRPFSMITSDSAQLAQITAAEANNMPVFISDWSQYTFSEFYNIEQEANIDNSCTDAIIVNGKGSVTCLSRDQITAFTSPLLAPILAHNDPSQLTDKGCLPPNLLATQGNYTFNTAAIPANAYSQCTPTSGAWSVITVDKASGWAVLTFINSGGFSSLKFTIDNHKLWVYAVNGGYVTPFEVDQVEVDGGDRYSVLVKLDQDVAQYQIRVANNGLNQIISGGAILEYKGATGPPANPVSVMNYAGINTTQITTFVDALGAPFPAMAPAATADSTFSFDIKKLGNPWNWTLSGTNPYSMDNDDQVPLLFQDPNSIPASDLIIKTKNGTWVDLIIKVEGPLAQPHPIHKHNNKAFMLGQGTGPFPYATVAEAASQMPAGTFNFATPPYRDGFTTIPAEGNSSWMALRYYVNNPGAWMIHCHMQTHLSGGMAAVLLDGVDKFPTIPAAYENGNCGFDNSTPGSGSFTSSGQSTSSSSSSSSQSTGVAPFTGGAVTISPSALTSCLLAGLSLAFTFFSL